MDDRGLNEASTAQEKNCAWKKWKGSNRYRRNRELKSKSRSLTFLKQIYSNFTINLLPLSLSISSIARLISRKG